ncbi:MAG: hypothetical protein PHE36_10555, partial [Novosphingobium sp.]|nr:hypothetical protein [Novosphingobium sp.]
GVVLALFIEGLLLLALLTLGQLSEQHEKAPVALSTFEISPDQAPAATPPEPSPQKARKQPAPKQTPPPKPEETQPAPPLPAFIRLSPDQMAAADISRIPTRQDKPVETQDSVVGPPDIGRPTDTPRMAGAGPHGEPLYAAAWYREPTDDELRGYLSTASGPGWGLIACRTVPDFRVEDCVIVDEYPKGSNIARAVLAASWQFRVRPPRLGGRSMVGEWVGIRIDYDLRRR